MTSSNDLTAGSRLRSAQWHGGEDRNAYIHPAWMRRGVPGDAFTGRPHIAIANTASDLTPVQRPPDRGGRIGEERCVRGRRHPTGVAGGVVGRNPAPSHRDAVAQHGRDGNREDASGQPDRRRSATRRLRQDHPFLVQRTSSSTADGLSSSTASKTSTPASTILTSMWMRSPAKH
jgi:hypothetical protein